MKVHYVKRVEGCEVVIFLHRGWVDLASKGLTDQRSVLISGDMQCVYAKERGRVVGAITFWKTDSDGAMNINLGYVDPRHRRKGIYRELWGELVKKSQEQGCRWISSMSSPHNKDIAAFNKSAGRYAYAIQYRYDI